jgi:hypothetical protein
VLVERGYVSPDVLNKKDMFMETNFEVVYDRKERQVSALFPARGQTIVLDSATGKEYRWRLEGNPDEYLLSHASTETFLKGETIKGDLITGLPTNVEIRKGLPKEEMPIELRNDRYPKSSEIILIKGRSHYTTSEEEPRLSAEDIIILATQTIVYDYPVSEVIVQPVDDNTAMAASFQVRPEKIDELKKKYTQLIGMDINQALFMTKYLLHDWAVYEVGERPDDYLLKEIREVDIPSVKVATEHIKTLKQGVTEVGTHL